MKNKRKKRYSLILCCIFLLFAGCAKGGEADQAVMQGENGIYSVDGHDIQIHLPEGFDCTGQKEDELLFEGKNGMVTVSYRKGNAGRTEFIPKTEEDCTDMYEEIIGKNEYQITDFHTYPDEGIYQTTIRYMEGNEAKYFIASGNFDSDGGYEIISVISSGTRENLEEMQNVIYNIKVFRD